MQGYSDCNFRFVLRALEFFSGSSLQKILSSSGSGDSSGSRSGEVVIIEVVIGGNSSGNSSINGAGSS